MSKVEYKARQQWAALRALTHEDGIPAKVLSELAGLGKSTFYKYVKANFDEVEVMPAHHFGALADGLAREWSNYRLLLLDLPDNAELVLHGDSPYRANGLHDEIRDFLLTGGLLGEADRDRDPDRVRQVIQEIEEIKHRLETEERALRGQQPVVSFTGDGAGVAV